MSEEDNKEKRDVFDLIGLQYELRKKRWDDPTLTKEERGELYKKEKAILNELDERRGEVFEMLEKSRNRSVEERQQIIDNAETILSRAKGLSPEMKEKSYKAVELMKKLLENYKVNKGSCPHCGKSISLQARFCSKCGKKIENIRS